MSTVDNLRNDNFLKLFNKYHEYIFDALSQEGINLADSTKEFLFLGMFDHVSPEIMKNIVDKVIYKQTSDISSEINCETDLQDVYIPDYRGDRYYSFGCRYSGGSMICHPFVNQVGLDNE